MEKESRELGIGRDSTAVIRTMPVGVIESTMSKKI